MELLKSFQKAVETRKPQGLANLAIRSALALTALTVPIAVRAQENTPNLTIEVTCADSSVPDGQPNFLLPPRIQVAIKGENIGSPNNRQRLVQVGEMGGSAVMAPENVVWTQILDTRSGLSYTLSWSSTEDSNLGANLDGYLSSIRRPQVYQSFHQVLEGDPNFIRPFTNYEVIVGEGSYTEGTPQIHKEIARAAFNADCTNVPTWALPA